MNKTLIIAAAGSGKTWGLCNHAINNLKEKNILLITYTHQGKKALEEELKKQNTGILHPKIKIMTWYSFLLSECIKPYQSFITKYNSIRSISFEESYGQVNFHSSGDYRRYITKENNIRSNQASELACYLNKISNDKVISRLDEVYNYIYIDEVQDLSGWDLDFVQILLSSQLGVYLVGDPKQSTYKTNTGTKNKNKSGRNLIAFFSNLIRDNKIVLKTSNKTNRFNKDIAKFVNLVDSVEPLVQSDLMSDNEYDGVFIIEQKIINYYLKIFNPQCLRYDKRTPVESTNVMNYGVVKGRTFDRVLIYPNGKFKDFLFKNKSITAPEKYYIAATRARKSLAFVVDKFPIKIPNQFTYVDYKDSNDKILFRMLKYNVE